MSAAIDQFQPLLKEEKERYQADFLAKPFAGKELLSLVSKNIGQAIALS